MKHRLRQHPLQSITQQRKRFIHNNFINSTSLFLLLEFSLRLFHNGPDLSLFTMESIEDKLYYTLNPSVTNRYFNHIHLNLVASATKINSVITVYRLVFGKSLNADGYPVLYLYGTVSGT